MKKKKEKECNYINYSSGGGVRHAMFIRRSS